MTVETKMIYVLDDDEDSREMVAAFLEINGHVTKAFATPEEALEAIAAAPPAVLLTDITLRSDIDGYEVARRVRAIAGAEHVHIVATTGLPEASVRKVGAPFDTILLKPVDLDVMLGVLKRATA